MLNICHLQISRLEELLSAEVEKNKALRARLDKMEEASSNKAGDGAKVVIGAPTVSDEYSYLAGQISVASLLKILLILIRNAQQGAGKK